MPTLFNTEAKQYTYDKNKIIPNNIPEQQK